jgi:YaiO family outer membrane protein
VGFGDGIDIYSGMLSKAHGSWLVSGRVFHAPSAPQDVSTALSAIARRYVGEGGSYLQAQFGRGAWHEELRTINDLEVLAATGAGGEAALVLNEHLALTVSGGYAREDRIDRRDLRQSSLGVRLALRF